MGCLKRDFDTINYSLSPSYSLIVSRPLLDVNSGMLKQGISRNWCVKRGINLQLCTMARPALARHVAKPLHLTGRWKHLLIVLVVFSKDCFTELAFMYPFALIKGFQSLFKNYLQQP